MIEAPAPATAAMVASHYDELDLAYRRVWGEHVHHGLWRTGKETPEEAADALVRLVESHLALRSGHKVCDIGCGYGATAASLLTRHAIAVDAFTLSSVQAAVARGRKLPNLAVHCRDWLQSGLAANSFDRAYAIESSEHMADKRGFFAEAARVLRPGGRLVVCAWLEGERCRPWQRRHLLEPICIEGRLPSMGSRADYEALAAAAGLALVSVEDISRQVRRTWSTCLKRLAVRVLADTEIRRLVTSSATRNRDFILSLPRLMIALRTGAMDYGVFVWRRA